MNLIMQQYKLLTPFTSLLFQCLLTMSALIYPISFGFQSDTKSQKSIAPGIEHLEIHRSGSDPSLSEQWRINVLLVAPKQGQIKLARAMDEIIGTETTSSLAKRYGALAAVNAGYFRTTGIYRGEPNGIFFLNGKILSEDYQNRAALVFGANNESPIITHVATACELVVGKNPPVKVNGFNRPRELDELIIFTPEFHRTTLTNPDGDEYVVSDNRVISIRKNQGSSKIPAQGFVISVRGKMRTWLQENLQKGAKIKLTIQTKFDDILPFAPVNIVGGGPLLLRAGKILNDSEHFNQASFINQKHPRTAYGKRADGTIVLVTVDGRQPQKSVGMTIPELTQLMIELGCEEALNLDGGGSTTMVINNKVVNSVSDATGERPVSDALLIFKK